MSDEETTVEQEESVDEATAELSEEEQAMADLKAELIKWMFLFWLGTVATMLGFGRLLFGV